MNAKIYGIVSFQKQQIRLLVVEKTPTNDYCLFNNYLKLDYLNESGIFIDREFLVNQLASLINEANIFLETKLTHLIVNLDYISATINMKTKVIKNHPAILDQAFIKKVLNDCLMQTHLNVELTNFEIAPIYWKIDENKFFQFPFNEKGGVIELKYLEYAINTKLHSQYIALFETLNLKILAMTTSEMGLGYLASTKKTHQFIINIANDYTTINLYKNLILSKTEVINQGNSLIVNDLASKIKLPYKDCHNLITNVSSVNENDNFPLINIFNPNYLSLDQVNYHGFKNALNTASQKLKTLIDHKLQEMTSKTHSCSEIIYVNNQEYKTSLIAHRSSLCFNCGLIMREFKINLLGIDFKSQFYLMGIINKVHHDQLTLNYQDWQTINPPTNDLINKQFQHELITKINQSHQKPTQEK